MKKPGTTPGFMYIIAAMLQFNLAFEILAGCICRSVCAGFDAAAFAVRIKIPL